MVSDNDALEIFNHIVNTAKELYEKDGFLEPVLFILKDKEMHIIPMHEVLQDEESKEKGAFLLQFIINKLFPDLVALVCESNILMYNEIKKEWIHYDNAAHIFVEFINPQGNVKTYTHILVFDAKNKKIIDEKREEITASEGRFSFLNNMVKMVNKSSNTDELQ